VIVWVGLRVSKRCVTPGKPRQSRLHGSSPAGGLDGVSAINDQTVGGALRGTFLVSGRFKSHVAAGNRGRGTQAAGRLDDTNVLAGLHAAVGKGAIQVHVTAGEHVGA